MRKSTIVDVFDYGCVVTITKKGLNLLNDHGNDIVAINEGTKKTNNEIHNYRDLSIFKDSIVL